MAEHRLARLVQLGVRQARYFGRKKTLFQAQMAATVANLTLVAGKVAQNRESCIEPCPVTLFFARAKPTLDLIWHRASSLITPFSPLRVRAVAQTLVFG